ncbi:MAG: radical SAM protein [Nitrospira sp.]|nr:radical SAM protein [Nitrospira sp.]
MDFIFVSMPYARFISKWFSNIPNINLGIMQALLTGKGKSVKTFHFHLEFLPYLRNFNPKITENLIKLTEQFGVEYMGLDYIFASLLFEDNYVNSKERFRERLESVGLTLNDFEELREVVSLFFESVYLRLSPYLKGTKLIGFSCSHYQLSSSLFMCQRIKNANPDIVTIIGGKDCSGAFAYELLENIDFVDFVGISECEVTVDSLLEHIYDTRKDFYNVVYRDERGEIKKSKSKPNTLLNSLPFPRYDFTEFPIEFNEVILPIEFGRGCPWKRCTFCPDESYNILCQSKTAGRLKEEIDYYQDISGDLRNFFILDPDALKNQKVIIDVSEYLEGKNLNFHYAEFRAEKMNREVLNAILHFGNWISKFQIGIETFSDRILQLMNKGVTVLKNVEVIKTAAELGVPVQSNLFTCYPKMTTADLLENLRTMDLITHLLVYENIQIFPGEFYLPTDCPIFMNSESYGLKKGSESIFSYVFEDFPMHSYSNYPYPYQFDNDEEQFRMSSLIRRKVEEIKNKSPKDNSMIYEQSSNGFQIKACRDGQCTTHTLDAREKEIYLSAIEKIQEIGTVSEKSGIPLADVYSILDDFEGKGLILYSPDRISFLSLATKNKKLH